MLASIAKTIMGAAMASESILRIDVFRDFIAGLNR